MTCPNCHGIGSVVKTNPKSGEFEVRNCSCQLRTKLYFCRDTMVVLEVTEVAGGAMSILEHHPSGKLRRIINQWLFEENLKDEIIIPHH